MFCNLGYLFEFLGQEWASILPPPHGKCWAVHAHRLHTHRGPRLSKIWSHLPSTQRSLHYYSRQGPCIWDTEELVSWSCKINVFLHLNSSRFSLSLIFIRWFFIPGPRQTFVPSLWQTENGFWDSETWVPVEWEFLLGNWHSTLPSPGSSLISAYQFKLMLGRIPR